MGNMGNSHAASPDGRIIDEDGVPVTTTEAAGASSSAYDQQFPGLGGLGGGPLGASMIFDPFKGKHPLKTKIGWKLVGLAAIGIAVIVGLIFLSAVVLAFVLPTLLIVAALFWLGRRLGGRSAPSGSGIARR